MWLDDFDIIMCHAACTLIHIFSLEQFTDMIGERSPSRKGIGLKKASSIISANATGAYFDKSKPPYAAIVP